MTRIEEYLARAEEAHMRAECAREGLYRDQMTRVAEQWRALARQAAALEEFGRARAGAQGSGLG